MGRPLVPHGSDRYSATLLATHPACTSTGDGWPRAAGHYAGHKADDILLAACQCDIVTNKHSRYPLDEVCEVEGQPSHNATDDGRRGALGIT
jgi:hypothetical protein